MIIDTKGRKRRRILKALMSFRKTGRFIFLTLQGYTAAQIANGLGIPLAKAQALLAKSDEMKAMDTALGNLIDAIKAEIIEQAEI